jgi:hypothetical protein
MRISAAIFLVQAVLALAQAGNADEFIFKDGSILEGTVVKENGKVLCVETDAGEFWIMKDELKKKTDFDITLAEYRKKAGSASNAKKHWEIAQWCRDNGLMEQYENHIERILKIDCGNDEAGQALGLAKTEGKYVPEGIDKTKQGLVKCLGEWVSREDREKIERGFVKQGEEWVPREDYKKNTLIAEKERQAKSREESAKKTRELVAEEDRKAKQQLGAAYRADYVEGFIIHTNVPANDCKLFCQVMADFRKQWLKDFGGQIKLDKPVSVYFFQTRDDYLKGTSVIEPAAVEVGRSAPAFAATGSDPNNWKIMMWKDDSRTGLQYPDYLHNFAHELTHFYMDSAVLNKNVPEHPIGKFFYEATASFFEGFTCDEKTRTPSWKTRNPSRLESAREARGKYSLRTLAGENRRQFSTGDQNVKYNLGEMLVNYLVNYEGGRHRKGFLKFIASYRDPKETEPDRMKRLEKYVGIPLEQMERECEKHTAARKE